MTASELQEFMTKRGTFPAYVKACAAYSIPVLTLLTQACTAARACEDSIFQKMDESARLATGAGFMKTITYDALREPVRLGGATMPNLGL